MSINNSTPLIKPLRNQAGTFYTFPSAVKHINSLFDNDQYKMEFSKFALLDLPEVAFETPSNLKNKIYPELLEGRRNQSVTVEDDLNENRKNELPASFQNFLLNFETLLFKRTEYEERFNLSTMAERLFFKWLIETGAIRLEKAEEETTLVDGDTVEENRRYKEEGPSDDATQSYSQIVKHVGDINILNRLTVQGQSFSEIYVNVPSGHGDTPYTLFESVKDNNYTSNLTITAPTYIEGQDSEFVTESDLPLTTFNNGTEEYETSNDDNYNAWGTTPLTETITPLETGYSNDVLKSVLDGIQIDFDSENYKEIQDRNLEDINGFNESVLSDNFKFNAILIYFDVHKKDGEGNWVYQSTNLYGVQFISPPVKEGSGDAETVTIPSLQKFKTNALGQRSNGNSYGFRLNVIFDTTVEQLTETVVVNDDNSSFLELFRTVTSELQKSNETLTKMTSILQNYEKRINQLEENVFSSGALAPKLLDERLRELEQLQVKSSPVFEITDPASTWIINHNLNMYPGIIVVDNDDNVMYPGIKYINDSKIEINFGRPENGKVYLNVANIDGEIEPATFTTNE